MDTQNANLVDEELKKVSGGQLDTPVFRTVLDMSAASTPVSSIIKKRDELQMSIIRKL